MTKLMTSIQKTIKKVEKTEVDFKEFETAKNIIIDAIHHYFTYIAVINGNLFFWDGKRYEKLEDVYQEKSFFIKLFIKQLTGMNHVNTNIINSIYSELLNDYHLSKRLDQYLNVINLDNGVLGFKNNGVELLPHSPEYGFRYIIPYKYDSNAKAPRFLQFLKETFDDEETRKFLLEYMGFILLGRGISIETALFLLGEGRNGKSVWNNTLAKLVGEENTSYVELQDLANPNKVILIDGKLLNVGSDSSDKNFDTSQFKKAISSEPILGRQLYKDVYTIKDIPKFVFAMNNLPFSQGDTSFGLLRRIKIVKFSKIINEDKVDSDLSKKLEAELPGILNLAIEGAMRLIKQGGRFTESEAINQEIKSYEDDINMVKRFIDDLEIIHDVDNRISNQQLYSIFSQWCKDEGIKSPQKRYLIKKMKSSNFETYKNNSIRGFKIITNKTVKIDVSNNEKDDFYYKNHPLELKQDRKI